MTVRREIMHASGDLADIKPDDSSEWVGFRVRGGNVWWANYRAAAYNGTLIVAGTRLACEAAARLLSVRS